uniref:Uncharacterized protein n=1 Tax=Manihot esculenta TaxID=3983 RepID=A0A2C9USC5_MANES
MVLLLLLTTVERSTSCFLLRIQIIAIYFFLFKNHGILSLLCICLGHILNCRRLLPKETQKPKRKSLPTWMD